MNQKQLATQLEVAESDITRLLSLAKPLLDLAMAVSDALTLPYPVILPDTEGEATHLATQRRLYKRDVQIDEITTGVAENPKESQTPPVTTEHGSRKRQRQKKQPGARPRAG